MHAMYLQRDLIHATLVSLIGLCKELDQSSVMSNSLLTQSQMSNAFQTFTWGVKLL